MDELFKALGGVVEGAIAYTAWKLLGYTIFFLVILILATVGLITIIRWIIRKIRGKDKKRW